MAWRDVLWDLGSMTSVAKEIAIGKQRMNGEHDRELCK